jgi:hypothetical protein
MKTYLVLGGRGQYKYTYIYSWIEKQSVNLNRPPALNKYCCQSIILALFCAKLYLRASKQTIASFHRQPTKALCLGPSACRHRAGAIGRRKRCLSPICARKVPEMVRFAQGRCQRYMRATSGAALSSNCRRQIHSARPPLHSNRAPLQPIAITVTVTCSSFNTAPCALPLRCR